MLTTFFGGKDEGFSLFSLQHILPIVVMVIIIYIIYRYRDNIRQHPREGYVRNILAGILLVSYLAFTWHATYIGDSDMGNVLPLMLCYMAMLLSIFMLLNKSQFLFEILYFWVVCGTTLALIYPAATNEFSFLKFRYYQYWIGHTTLVIGIFYVIFVHGFRVTKRSIVLSLGFLIPYAGVTLLVNHEFKSEYMFLSTSTETWQLGFIPSFPYNVLFMVSVAVVLIPLAYLPFHYLGRFKGEHRVNHS